MKQRKGAETGVTVTRARGKEPGLNRRNGLGATARAVRMALGLESRGGVGYRIL